jgi:thiosulfate/3-mercaptopyruvate sulfurtransferase
LTDPLDLIVTADWLAAHRNEPNLVVVDVRPADSYDAGHVPGARHIDLYPMKLLDSDPGRIAAWVEAMQAAFRRLGIVQGDRVVFYEDYSGTTAARGAWLMCALSIGKGAMLDGGMAAWMVAGHRIDTAPVEVAPSEVTARLDPALFATASDVLDATESDGAIVDTRGALEWIQGTIPTARHLEWTHHLNPNGTLKPLDELRAMYEGLGLSPDDEIITFCASGYRAAHTWLVLTMLGYANVRNYAPSWGEWGRRPDLPVAPTR